MCTAAVIKTGDLYFGRTLDNDFIYNEEVTVTPRNFPFVFKYAGVMKSHHAIIGMAYVNNGYPLYYDAVNEKGLCIAGLNFIGNAVYNGFREGVDNIAQFELIPWILGQCDSVKQTEKLIRSLNITQDSFSSDLPASQLHWIVADRERSITVESVSEGLKVYDNPVGILTNNPPFDKQLFNLNNYINLSASEPKNNFYDKLDLKVYSRGMGAIGLPGDLSSQSRFVRAAFVKLNSVSGKTEKESINQFFHVLNSVEQQRGCCRLENKRYEITVYTSCCNADKGIYYYTTYENHQINSVDMNKEKLESHNLISYPIIRTEHINNQN